MDWDKLQSGAQRLGAYMEKRSNEINNNIVRSASDRELLHKYDNPDDLTDHGYEMVEQELRRRGLI